MPIVVTNLTIAAGASLSNAVDCTNKAPQVIFIPPGWNGANLSFQLSPDNITYYDLYNPDGTLLQLICVGDTCMVIPGSIGNVLAAWVKVQSGSKAFPVPQASSCLFKLVIVS